jgi:hypothetical protein
MQSNQGKVRSVYGSGGYYDADSQELARYSGYAIPAEDGSGVIYVRTTVWFECCPVFVHGSCAVRCQHVLGGVNIHARVPEFP